MTDVQPVAIVGIAAIMPMAPDADAFWANITGAVSYTHLTLPTSDLV